MDLGHFQAGVDFGVDGHDFLLAPELLQEGSQIQKSQGSPP
jgi:hypothetical protein